MRNGNYVCCVCGGNKQCPMHRSNFKALRRTFKCFAKLNSKLVHKLCQLFCSKCSSQTGKYNKWWWRREIWHESFFLWILNELAWEEKMHFRLFLRRISLPTSIYASRELSSSFRSSFLCEICINKERVRKWSKGWEFFEFWHPLISLDSWAPLTGFLCFKSRNYSKLIPKCPSLPSINKCDIFVIDKQASEKKKVSKNKKIRWSFTSR